MQGACAAVLLLAAAAEDGASVRAAACALFVRAVSSARPAGWLAASLWALRPLVPGGIGGSALLEGGALRPCTRGNRGSDRVRLISSACANAATRSRSRSHSGRPALRKNRPSCRHRRAVRLHLLLSRRVSWARFRWLYHREGVVGHLVGIVACNTIFSRLLVSRDVDIVIRRI